MDENRTQGGSNAKLVLKSNYAVKQKWEPFYTGGYVDISKDGTFLLCMCGDRIQILDVSSGLVEKALSHDDGDITCFKLSPDDEFVVSATRSFLLKQWDWQEGRCVRTWKAIHTAPVVSMDYDCSSTLLATGGSDGTIKVWDLVRQYCTHNFKGSSGVVATVRFHPSNLTLFSSADEYDIKVWDLNTSKCMAILEGHNSAVTSMQFPSDDCMISAGRDNIVALWDVPTEPTSARISPCKVIPIFKPVEDVLVLNDNYFPTELVPNLPHNENDFYFSTCGPDGVIRVWNSGSGQCICSTESSVAEKSHPGYAYSKILPKFNQMLCVTDDHRFDFLNLKNLKLEKHLIGYNDDILDIKVLGKNEDYMIVATNSPNIKVFHSSSSSCQVLQGHTDIVLCLDVFSNKVAFVSSSKDNSIRLWTLVGSSVQCLCKVSGHTHAVSCVATCKINNAIFASGSEDCTLKIWTIKKSKKDGVLATARSTIKAHDKMINCIAVSPNDKLVATGSQDKLAKLWDIDSGKQIKVFQGHKRGIWCAQFSPMDQVLATSSADSTVKLWSLMDGICLKTFEGHDASVLKLAFISLGTQILTTGSDGLVKLWTVKSSECVQTMDEHMDRVWALSTANNDQTVFTGSGDSVIIAWKDMTEQMQQEAAETREKQMLNYQELQNLLQEKRYSKALLLAIRLSQPFTALNVIKELLWEEDGNEQLESIVQILKNDQKQTLFKFVVSWNSNSRNCHEAQAVLRAILLYTHPEEIEKYPDAQSTIEALLPYTDRHFQRLSRIAQQATFLDYTWCVMKMAPVDIN